MVIIDTPTSEFHGHLQSWQKYQAASTGKKELSNVGRFSMSDSVSLQAEEIQPQDRQRLPPKRKQFLDERQIKQLVKTGVEHHRNGDFKEAIESFQAALKGQLLQYGGDHPTIAQTLGNIGAVFLRQGELAKAGEALQKSLDITEQLRAKCQDDKERRGIPLANVLNNLGNLAYLQGNFAQSIQFYRQNLRELRRREFPDSDLATALHNIGRLHVIRQEWDGASSILAQCQKVEEDIYGPKSLELADTLELIGYVHFSNKCLDSAMIAFSEALSIHQRHLGAVHEHVAAALINMAMVMEALGNLKHACQTYETAREVFKSVGVDEKAHRGFQAAKQSHENLQMRILYEKKKEEKKSAFAFQPISPGAERDERESLDQLYDYGDSSWERRD
jgi:tetratricopeptide (TPR) repeat protein